MDAELHISACDCADHIIEYSAKYDEESELYIHAATNALTGDVIVRAVRRFHDADGLTAGKYVLATAIPEEFRDDARREGGINAVRRLVINVAIAIAAQIHTAKLCAMGQAAELTPLAAFLPTTEA